MTDLKLFVWEGVFCDYTCGMAVALAHDIEEAKKVMCQRFEEHEVNELINELTDDCLVVVDEPKGFYVYGGG